ncbi:MAG: hypothetical protein QOF51_3845 [Chloroflexota bacterium]|nr:hypothetical protein [Chloroflexota bacterium]
MDDQEARPNTSTSRARWTRAQWGLVGLIVSLAAGMVGYQLAHYARIDQTAALFIGLPTLLAIALTLAPRAGSATGMIMKGLTIALLMSGPVLKEGFICILMASPLIYLVGAIVGKSLDADKRREEEGGTRLYSFILIPLLLASMEGVTPALMLPTAMTVQADRSVTASPEAVEAKLASTPDFSRPLPAFLQMKFPQPVDGEGGGLVVGDRRTIHYAGKAAPRELVFVVAERSPGYVRFHALSDNTKISEWLAWQDAEVRWQATPGGSTAIQWTLHFERRLSPGWYFGPLESYGATEAAGYLIDSLATP